MRKMIVAIVIVALLVGSAAGAYALNGGVSGDSSHPTAPVAPADPSRLVTTDTPGTAPRLATITGRVTGSDGQPIVGVNVLPSSRTTDVPEIVKQSDTAGHYQWALPAGTFTFTVNREGYASATKTVTVVAGDALTLDFVLTPQG